MSELPSCHDCAVSPGEPHLDGCDVARCLVTGGQRLQCYPEAAYDPSDPEWDEIAFDHYGDCGQDIWTGEWPGDADCRRLGFWCRWEVDGKLAEFGPPTWGGVGRWARCEADDDGATPDLNRLVVEAFWNRSTCQWELP